MKIKGIATDKANELRDKMAAQARSEFIAKVMKWEDVDYETAYAICIGKTDPKEPEYTLGYKMADPMMQMAMHGQLSKKSRAKAVEIFEETLDPDELELFMREVVPMNMRTLIKDEFKRKRKEKPQ